jgi:hypothetical protein
MHTRGVRGEGGYETAPPKQIFKKLVIKNAIKRQIGGPPWQLFLKPLTPLGILAKTSSTPPPGFSTRVHLCFSQLTVKVVNYIENLLFYGSLKIF